MVVGDLEGCIAFRMGKYLCSVLSLCKKIWPAEPLENDIFLISDNCQNSRRQKTQFETAESTDCYKYLVSFAKFSLNFGKHCGTNMRIEQRYSVLWHLFLCWIVSVIYSQVREDQISRHSVTWQHRHLCMGTKTVSQVHGLQGVWSSHR